MKLNIYLEKSRKLLDDLVAMERTWCDHGDKCMEKKITSMIDVFEETYKDTTAGGVYVLHAKFFRAVARNDGDGRSCPGPDMHRFLKMLTTEEWRTQLHIVEAGIRSGVIVLEQKDLDKLAM